MNPHIARLQPYPFEKLRALTQGITPAKKPPIYWSIGEPKHEVPPFLKEVLLRHYESYSKYPTILGLLQLREAIVSWLETRFLKKQSLLSTDNVIPVNGTREALFSLVQALYDPVKKAQEIWMPNPFYQIYEGAALLANAPIRFLNSLQQTDYQPNYESIPEHDWQQCQMLFICTPGNPSGTVLSQSQLKFLIEKSKQHDFIIISDECYSEIYRDKPPIGLLQAAVELGDHQFDNLLVAHSLSKRSNLPGLRSGFVAGDKALIKHYWKYRTYHGCNMPLPHQYVSIAAWQDESHVIDNRQQYNQKYHLVQKELEGLLSFDIPKASFYLWLNIKQCDQAFSCKLLTHENLHVLPGQYLSRTVEDINPGYGYIRVALVAPVEECLDAAKRLRSVLEQAL